MREPKYPDSAPRRSYAEELAERQARIEARGEVPDWKALAQEVRNAVLAAKPRRGRPKGARQPGHA